MIMGDVTIGADCVIHPTAYIVARGGLIVIGNGNLIEERVRIINDKPTPMIVGDHNVFEVDAVIEASKVGNNNILEAKSHLGSHTQLGDNCIIGAGCVIVDNTSKQGDTSLDIFPNNTVITGSDLKRRVVKDLPPSSHSSQMDFLRKILPNYQKLLRPAVMSAVTPAQR